MRIVVNDSSALIDLKKGGLLAAFLDLPYELIVPDGVLADELLSFTKAEVALMRRKMTVTRLNGEQVRRAQQQQRSTPALAVYDCAAFVIAVDEKDAILLTGDRRLREVAQNAQIECHGILWVVDELAKAELAGPRTLLRALERWHADSLIRLPRHELERAILRLRKGP